jgi:hypothetical protein
MSTPPSELKVITECKRLNEYVFHVTEKSPRKYRYSLVERMDNLCLDVISLLYGANDIRLGEKGRLEKQREAQTKLRLLDYVCEMADGLKCITFDQYQFISKSVCACLRLLESWIASDLRRLSRKPLQEG